ncbi:hypothetical protein CDL15_Pgr014925 [Punica granatum]|uniref:Uncharacterized protein n=1 Tax=Punica granatum TaxID=22663 RepID=A0A218Y258_PUNGR|nr:hypothetical protein CDL15_Pgr014925 [Punica granatum]
MDKLYGLPCSDIFSNGMRKHFSLTSTGQHKQVLGISSGRKCNFLQGHSHINFQKARKSPDFAFNLPLPLDNGVSTLI